MSWPHPLVKSSPPPHPSTPCLAPAPSVLEAVWSTRARAVSDRAPFRRPSNATLAGRETRPVLSSSDRGLSLEPELGYSWAVSALPTRALAPRYPGSRSTKPHLAASGTHRQTPSSTRSPPPAACRSPRPASRLHTVAPPSLPAQNDPTHAL
ncbi:hypothetical protein C8Q77DRAFT_550642 [Trametes polyzona]|nr:hypothetical protein C8Q77DRAFT_550642 [Trametes polyzona]